MCHKILCILLFFALNSVMSRHVPRYSELDEEDKHLFRAAYDTPFYDHEEYEEDDDNNLDLMKDGLWAIKAKLKELKAFDKALAANMLSTNLKIKDLLENHMGDIFKHHHKKKPANEHQSPSYQPQYGVPQYGAPQYGAPQYGAPQYGAQQHGVGAPQYGAEAPQYGHDRYYGH